MSDPDVYDLAPQGPPDAATGTAKPADAPAPAAPPLAYLPVARRARDDYDVTEGSAFRNLYFPIALALVGCAAVIGRMVYFRMFRTTAPELATAWRWTGFMLAWNVGVMLLGVFLVAKLTGIAFGPLSTATIKLAAIAVGPQALTLLVEVVSGGGAMGVGFGWLAGIAFALWLFMYLFDLDPQEAVICVGVTTVLRWLSYVVYWIA